MPKTLDQVTTELISEIVTNFSPRLVDTRVGTVLRDAFVGPISAQFRDAFSDIDQVSQDQSVVAPSALSDEVMDGLAANFGISRFSGSPAAGIVRFFKVVSPTSTITIPAGTRVSTADTNQVESVSFKTLSSVQLTSASPPDPVSGAQASVDVAIQSETNGAVGNVDAGTITFVLVPISGVDGVLNPSALTGGKSSQTNAELADLIKAKAQGRLGTRSGYRDLILSNFSVDDVEIVGHEDPEALRDQFGGEVDIVVLSSNSVNSVETFAYVDSATTTQLIPTFRPLISVGSIAGVNSSDAPITLIGPAGGVGIGGAGSDYDVILDTTGPNAGSNRENSKIALHPTTNIPKNNSTLTVAYSDNDQIRVMQSFLELDDNRVVGADVLAKAGVKVNTVVDADIKVIPGFTTTTVVDAAKTAVSDHFNSLKLGDDVQVSDVTAKIGGVAGVDSVDLTTFIMALSSAPTTALQEILAKKHEYIRASSVTVTAT